MDGIAGRAFAGVVDRIAPVATEGTRTLPVFVEVGNADGTLLGGMFATGGPLDDLGLSPGYGLVATVVTLSYLWLPYMILPMYAGLERLPSSLIEASADLGATTRTTMRTTTTSRVSSSVPSAHSTRPSWKTSWAPW